MREILFRGKRLDNGEWIEGSYLDFDADSGYAYIIKPHRNASTLPLKLLIWDNMHLVDPETIGQYTGLQDKNGVKIFEGDIVIARQDRITDKARIIFENSAFYVMPENGKIYEKTLYEYWYNDWDIEVIGNIYDTEID